MRRDPRNRHSLLLSLFIELAPDGELRGPSPWRDVAAQELLLDPGLLGNFKPLPRSVADHEQLLLLLRGEEIGPEVQEVVAVVADIDAALGPVLLMVALEGAGIALAAVSAELAKAGLHAARTHAFYVGPPISGAFHRVIMWKRA